MGRWKEGTSNESGIGWEQRATIKGYWGVYWTI